MDIEEYTGPVWQIQCPECGTRYLTSKLREPAPGEKCVKCLRAEINILKEIIDNEDNARDGK